VSCVAFFVVLALSNKAVRASNMAAGKEAASHRFEHARYEQTKKSSSTIGNSLCQLCLAPVVILLGCALLWYNEGVAIKTHRSLNEALEAYVNVPDALYMVSKHEGDLVHLSHTLGVASPAMDGDFGLTRDAVVLERKVEIFQWVEHHEKKEQKLQNGVTEVRDIYTYSTAWTASPVSSSRFQHPENHENHGQMPYTSARFHAKGVHLGAYALTSAFTSQLTEVSIVPLPGNVRLPKGAELVGNSVYFPSNGRGHGNYRGKDRSDAIEKKIMTIDGQDKIMYMVKSTGVLFSDGKMAMQAADLTVGQPLSDIAGDATIGDVRVTFTEVECSAVSVLGKQAGNSLVSWTSAQGPEYNIAMLVTGQVSAGDMISGAQTTNTIWTWVKRLLGWLLNLIGIGMITQVVTATADATLNWIPFLGPMAASIINLGVSIANFILSLTLSVMCAAIAWIYYRPIFGVSMVLAACVLLFVSAQAGNNKCFGRKEV
jgi:hypothetical protein